MKTGSVGIISREVEEAGSSTPQRPYAGHLLAQVKRWSDLHGDMESQAEPKRPGHRVPAGVTEVSEIPCRVSSDLHEWRNESPTVSRRDPAKLEFRCKYRIPAERRKDPGSFTAAWQ